MTANSTSFKPGNQAGVTSGGGRPREYDREDIRLKIEEWSQRSDSIVLTQFSAEYSIPSDTVLEFAREDPVFRRTLSLARNRLAARREVMLHNNALHQASYNRYVKHYDTYLKSDEREEYKYEKETAAKAVADAGLIQDSELTIRVLRDNRSKVSTETLPTENS